MKKLIKRWLFPGSDDYWKRRYAKGGNSGRGSSGALAQFKADFLNDFVARHGVKSVIEFGCGDGQQLALATYPAYVGVDISPDALRLCGERIGARQNYRLANANDREAWAGKYDLALSLDVIFHLVEDEVFNRYMRDLFGAASRYVIVYASNEDAPGTMPHVRHRAFTRWIERERPDWRLLEHRKNPVGLDAKLDGTKISVDFFVFEKAA